MKFEVFTRIVFDNQMCIERVSSDAWSGASSYFLLKNGTSFMVSCSRSVLYFHKIICTPPSSYT